MNNVLNINELQYLDVLLKNIMYRAKSKKTLRVVIRDGSLLISGDFFIYKKHQPVRQLPHSDFIDENHLPAFPLKSVKEILQPYDDHTGTTNSAILAVTNTAVLLETILSNDFHNLVKNNPWKTNMGDELRVPPILYHPEFLNQVEFHSLPFYLLDNEKQYEVVSLLAVDA